MLNLPTIFALALAASSATVVDALEVKFYRYSVKGGCQKPHEYHIRKDTFLDAGHCKDFPHTEPAFYSFKVKAVKHKHDLEKKLCTATVFDEHNCRGNGFTYGDMKDYHKRCADTSVPGRSVRIECVARDATQNIKTASMSPLPSLQAVKPSSLSTSHLTSHLTSLSTSHLTSLSTSLSTPLTTVHVAPIRTVTLLHETHTSVAPEPEVVTFVPKPLGGCGGGCGAAAPVLAGGVFDDDAFDDGLAEGAHEELRELLGSVAGERE